MLTLALDTTTRVASAAAVEDGRLVGEWIGRADQSPAAQLPTGLAEALRAAGRTESDVDVVAVAVGPGSFTGLRVGIAAMQGLAVAIAKPLLGVSGLDALAAVASELEPMSPDLVAPWVDAWRGEVYAGLYRQGREVRPPCVAGPLDLLRSYEGPVRFVGDGARAHRDAVAAALGSRATLVEPLVPALAPAVARLAEARARRGARPAPDAVQPFYVRRSDAELSRDGRG
jgi:tRNA threonylcarbamoyladenosine biosynthesis protein TsaB